MVEYYQTNLGKIYHGDALDFLREVNEASVNLIMTSPPFGLLRKKDYGNVDATEYIEWFKPFAEQFQRVLSEDGSFVIDIGGSWKPGLPTRSLYHFKLLIMLCEEYGFHLAQEYFWWNPSKLPTPAEWVNIRRVRVKDAVNCVWWLSKTPYPKASNRRVLQPYSDSMLELLQCGYKPKKRPSGHDISENFRIDNKASIPPNLLAIPNTESNSRYLRYCKMNHLKPHPARFPVELPEYFVRMLTDKEDLVLDPFAGSCITGFVCERLFRKWICIELVEEYVKGAAARFDDDRYEENRSARKKEKKFYKIPNPGILWDDFEYENLVKDGGKKRPPVRNKTEVLLKEDIVDQKEVLPSAKTTEEIDQLTLHSYLTQRDEV